MKTKSRFVLLALALVAAASASAASLTVSWTNNTTAATGIKVQRATGTGGSFADVSPILAPTVTSWADPTTLAASTTYLYRVYCFNATDVSAFSNTATVTTTQGLPAPSGTTAAPTLLAKVTLQWGQQMTYLAGNWKPQNNGPYKQVPSGTTITVYQN